MKNLSQFGKAYLETLERNRPQMYRDLRRAGQLHDHVHQLDRRANATYQDLLIKLQEANPLPEGSEERAQALSGIASQARELVMNEILVRDEETEKAESGAGYL